MTPPVTVRPVDSFAAYRAGSRVIRLAWRAAFDHILPAESLPAPDAPADRLDELERTYEDLRENDTLLVAEAGRNAETDGDAEAAVVGFAHAVRDGDRTESFVPPGATELRALYVRPANWGEGAGSALLSRVESVAAGVADELRLRTFADNGDGRAFYRARGFEVVGEGAYEVGAASYPTVEFGKRLEAE